MSIDLVIHAGTKLALEQWLQARELGVLVQDTDPDNPTFGEWIYTNDDRQSFFYYWRHPSGKLEATPSTFYDGFYATLTFESEIPANVRDWVENNTATSILDGFNGVGGEGITIVNPEDVEAHLDAIGIPSHGLTGGMDWSDPSLWAFSNVMIGDIRTFAEVDYESLIDFNVWTPTQSPTSWKLVEEPDENVWAPSVAYEVGQQVFYPTVDDVEYRCTQAHTSQVGWEPPNVPALWETV